MDPPLPHELAFDTDVERAKLSSQDFARLSAFIEGRCGIHTAASKQTFLETRLRKRLRALGLSTFDQYCSRVLTGGLTEELAELVDAITTNKTDFFRESPHFDLLAQLALPELVQRPSAGVRPELKVWSAGCATGEEPYTLAMVLSEALGESGRFRILATDISHHVLKKAASGRYSDSQVQPVPLELRRKYLERNSVCRDQLRIAASLRARIEFRYLNLLDAEFGPPEVFDVIFCRNVLIYFQRQIQEQVLRRLCRSLVPSGFLFLGHAETINGMDLPLTPVAPTVYRRRDPPEARR